MIQHHSADHRWPCVYAMCGLAFSGKSSAARKITAELDIALVSLDAINEERGLDGGAGLPVERWEGTSHIAMGRLRSLLEGGRTVVIDNTFSHRFLRDRCRGVAARADARFVLLYMATPLVVIDRRRAANGAHPTRPRIDEDVFAAHRDGFQRPTPDEAAVTLHGDADLMAWIESERALQREARPTPVTSTA